MIEPKRREPSGQFHGDLVTRFRQYLVRDSREVDDPMPLAVGEALESLGLDSMEVVGLVGLNVIPPGPTDATNKSVGPGASR